MDYENDPYAYEDGKPLMKFDNIVDSDDEQPLDDAQNFNDFDDGRGADAAEDWRREESLIPAFNKSDPSDFKSKPRKSLIKKSDKHSLIPPELNNLEDDDGGTEDFAGDRSPSAAFVRDGSDDDFASSSKRRKGKSLKGKYKKMETESESSSRSESESDSSGARRRNKKRRNSSSNRKKKRRLSDSESDKVESNEDGE